MTTSQTQLEAALSEPVLKKFWLGYFQEGYRTEIYNAILETYEHLKKTKGITKLDLATRLGKRPEQITRWLSSPSNLEADTVSDLALAMGFVPKFNLTSVNSEWRENCSNHTNRVSTSLRLEPLENTDVTVVSQTSS